MSNEQTTVSGDTYQSPVTYHDQPSVLDAYIPTVSEDTYSVTSDTYHSVQGEVTAGLSDFYHSHVEGSIQIFHSLTLGEILIVILLASLLIVYVAKWIWEVV